MIHTADTKPRSLWPFVAPVFPFGEPIPAIAKGRHRHVKVLRGGIADPAVDSEPLAAHVEQTPARTPPVESAIGLQRDRSTPKGRRPAGPPGTLRPVTARLTRR